MKKLKLGALGLGRAFAVMLPTLSSDPRIELVAAADPREEARRKFQAEVGGSTYETYERLLSDKSVEAVYVATPHQFHAAQAVAAARAGKHVLVEKPMALSLEECRAMVDAAKEAGVALVVGHSHSFDAPIQRAREIIESGSVGAVRMITALNYTDFLYRPRRPEELSTALGGGAVFNQGAHQIDTVRLLGGGLVKSVRAATGAWDPARPTEGAYSCFLSFEDGAFATAVYSGYAHFDSDELCGWIGEQGHEKDPAKYGAVRKALRGERDELALKAARNYGGERYESVSRPRLHHHFGPLVVSCDKADLRPLPGGVMVYGDEERRLDPLAPPDVPRAEVMTELYEAAVNGRAPLHSGEWALATMEICFAILRSAREQKEIPLRNQIPAATASRT
jgi:phthalate 4,5-cis-dihydrodiol dehydrogenase